MAKKKSDKPAQQQAVAQESKPKKAHRESDYQEHSKFSKFKQRSK